MPVGSYYGEPTGIVGLRLFPNPDFDEKARKRLGLRALLQRPDATTSRRDLVRPYRVGMSCALLPRRPEPGQAAGRSGEPAVGEPQLERRRAVLLVGPRLRLAGRRPTSGSFFYQALHTSRPGTLDTSLVSTDNINNPRTMNAVYYLGPRMGLAKKLGQGDDRRRRARQQAVQRLRARRPIRSRSSSTAPDTTWTPRVLKDGSDSVGALGALNRVYLNIGLFSEEWLLHFRPLIGGRPISPIKIADAQKNSVYWQATELQTPDMARFFLGEHRPAST